MDSNLEMLFYNLLNLLHPILIITINTGHVVSFGVPNILNILNS